MKALAILLPLLLSGAAQPSGWTLIPGSWTPGRGPDGNTVLLDTPDGIIVVDTGRHPAHQAAILAELLTRKRRPAAIVNSHWHLDHSGGNAEIRAAYPDIPIIGSDAVDGALKGFFPRSRAGAEAHIASGKAPPDQIAEIRRDMAAMDDVANLRPTQAVTRSGPMAIGGRNLGVHLEPYAATAGDLWIYEPQARIVVAGDLVVALVPFMDTACPQGWRRALGNIAKVPFRTLVPGHGAPMDRAAFTRWRGAFDGLLDCAAGGAPRQVCIDGWMRDAAPFIPTADKGRVPGMVGYYIDTRLRAAPAEQARFCAGGPG